MNTQSQTLDTSFIEQQRQYLLQLKTQLHTAAEDDEADESNVRSSSEGGAQEYEDDAQKLAMLELDGNLVVRDVARLVRVDRALAKIEEGSYGKSDVSGQPIPRERLEAVPEAVCKLDEEEAYEKKSR